MLCGRGFQRRERYIITNLLFVTNEIQENVFYGGGGSITEKLVKQ